MDPRKMDVTAYGRKHRVQFFFCAKVQSSAYYTCVASLWHLFLSLSDEDGIHHFVPRGCCNLG